MIGTDMGNVGFRFSRASTLQYNRPKEIDPIPTQPPARIVYDIRLAFYTFVFGSRHFFEQDGKEEPRTHFDRTAF